MFSRITAKNLFSWEDLDYEIKPGVSQITGFNYDDCTPEGCGKSSVPNILCWVLYGGIPKDVRVDEVVRQGCKSGSGSVLLLNGYRVSRSRKPNDVYIVKPNGEVLKGKDAKETQVFINNLIGLDFDAFCQTIYFAQNYPKKFVAATDVEKVGILSQVLDLTVFDRARKKAQDLLKKEELAYLVVQNDLIRNDSEINKLKSNANLVADFIGHFESDKAAKVAALETKIETIREREKTLATKVAKYEGGQGLVDEIKNIDLKLELNASQKVQYSTTIRLAEGAIKTRKQLESSISFISGKIEKLLAKLDRFKDSDKTCPTCGEKVGDHKVEQVFKEVKGWEEELEDEVHERRQLEKQLKNLPEPSSNEEAKKLLAAAEQEHVKLTSTKRKLWDEQAQFKQDAANLQNLTRELKSLQLDLKKVEASECEDQLIKLTEIDKELTKVVERGAELLAQSKALQTKMANYEILKTGFKEVKQFVFQTLLNELTVKSTRLASELFEVPISIKFSNEDEEGGVTKILTTVTLDGNERSLGLYSGGQYRRIELAVDLALASIVGNRSQNPIKFRVLDEPFKDLSEPSMEKVVKLLEKLEGPTIIIEHNSVTKSIIHNVFDIEYRQGVSHAN